MNPETIETILCPYCGESINLFIDCSVSAQVYTEDCQVCCQPMVVNVEISTSAELRVIVRQENE